MNISITKKVESLRFTLTEDDKSAIRYARTLAIEAHEKIERMDDCELSDLSELYGTLEETIAGLDFLLEGEYEVD